MIRTDYANAVDMFDKVSPWFKESGTRMTNVTHNIGGDDNTFTIGKFEVMKHLEKMMI